MIDSIGRPIGPPPVPVTAPPPDAAAIADAFALGHPEGPATFAARGELGRIWRLKTSTGVWAVKELLEPWTEEEARVDASLASAAAAALVHTPLPRRTPDGALLADVRAGSGAWQVRVHTWVDLLPGPVSAAPDQAAYLLGRLHALAIADDRPIDPWFAQAVPAERWDELASAAAHAAAPWAALLAQRVADLAATNELVLAGPTGPRTTCHRDFNPQNVLLGTDGSAVVVDWENCGPAVAECELAGALAEFEVPLREVRGFLAAYELGGGPPVRLQPSSFAGVLAVQQHLVEHYAVQALDETLATEERDRKVFWLDDILTHLFTVERVQRWVDATPR